MSSMGGYREGEIDGEPFFIFSYLTQPHHPSSSSFTSETITVSGGNNDLLQPLFSCPRLRFKAYYLKPKENEAAGFIPISISPHFPSGDQQVQDLLKFDGHIPDSNRNSDICKRSLAPLFWCNNQESAYGELNCEICQTLAHGTNYYFCPTCRQSFHKECVESPFEIKHPSFTFLSFQLSYPKENDLECFCCKAHIYGISYYCPTSKLSMHPFCAMQPIPLVIEHPKRHSHPLTFFPKQAFLHCNVCGLIKNLIPTYLCVPCVSVFHHFVVHQDCAYFPSVIKMSRHRHRISFTSSLPSGEWYCRVCRKEVDNNYGAYSCKKCDGYFVHTRCALRRDLWDGVELEGVDEEPEIVVPPFERKGDGIILHFSHDHLLKLETFGAYDQDKFCQACVLPIYGGNYYSRMDKCDFILHEACANAPRIKHHPLHAHPLTLKVVTNQDDDNKGVFFCDACCRSSCAFVYESDRGSQTFRLDLRCALVSEPFEYQGHDEHPLYLALTPEEEESAVCQICRETGDYRKLNCIKCDYVICFRCATLPYKARYKHDKHLLTFQKEKEESDESGWCELCEKKLVYSRNRGFYSCDDYCDTTLHVHCLLGLDTYMTPGQTIMYFGEKIHVLPNNTMSRPFCHYKDCGEDRCPYGIVFMKENKTFCSFGCAAWYK